MSPITRVNAVGVIVLLAVIIGFGMNQEPPLQVVV
jgi:hypothetical protein